MTRPAYQCKPADCDYWMVSKAANGLANYACSVSARHISDGGLRIQFNREVSYYAKGIVNDVAQGRKTPEQGLKEIKNEQKSLMSQSRDFAQKGIGVAAGAFQIVAGGVLCIGSAGLLCAVGGGAFIAHGANNVYENSRNLLEGRSDVQGPVRKGYQKVAKLLGKGDFEANMAYGTVDLGLSFYGMTKLTLKPDAWRLFRYIRTDYVRGYETAGKISLLTEGGSDAMTIRSMYLEVKNRDD